MADLTELLTGLMSLGYDPDSIDLNEFLKVIEEPRGAVEEPEPDPSSLKYFTGTAARLNPPAHNPDAMIDYFSGPALSEEEAAQVDKRIDQTIERLENIERRLREALSRVDSEARGESYQDGKELVITFRGRRPRLMRIIKKLFGDKTRTVTYSMYKEALEAKRLIEKQQVEEYTNPEPPEMDEEEED